MAEHVLRHPAILRLTHLTTAGHSHISYNADDAALFGAVSHWPAASHPPGAMREIYSWDLGIKLGEIPQPPKTYNVMGNANEQGLAIGETTHGGLSVLSNVGKTAANGTIMDYNNLISVTMQRASTAREAINTMAWLANTYGYASDMEGFSIADSEEVWYMELIGKGSFEKGVVWVALRVPDGYVSAHANQARITTFLPCDDPSACMAAPDAASFAIKHGLWSGKPDDPAFSFSDVYDPLTFEGLRFCEARVWYIFSRSPTCPTLTPRPSCRTPAAPTSARMPLFVKPKASLAPPHPRADGIALRGLWFDPSTRCRRRAHAVRWNGLSGVPEYDVRQRAGGGHPVPACSWRASPRTVPSPMAPCSGGRRRPLVLAEDSDPRRRHRDPPLLRRPQLHRALARPRRRPPRRGDGALVRRRGDNCPPTLSTRGRTARRPSSSPRAPPSAHLEQALAAETAATSSLRRATEGGGGDATAHAVRLRGGRCGGCGRA